MYSVFAVLWQHEDEVIAGIVQEYDNLFSWGNATLCMKKVYHSSLSTSQRSCCFDTLQWLQPCKGLFGILSSHCLRISSVSTSSKELWLAKLSQVFLHNIFLHPLLYKSSVPTWSPWQWRYCFPLRHQNKTCDKVGESKKLPEYINVSTVKVYRVYNSLLS